MKTVILKRINYIGACKFSNSNLRVNNYKNTLQKIIKI